MDGSRYICGDVSALPFSPERFDVVYTAGLVEHLFPEVFSAFVNEANRILVPGGKLVIGTPNPAHLLELMKRNNFILKEDVSHVDYKTTPRIVDELSSSGFEIDRAYYYPSHIPFLSTIERLTQSFIPIMRRRICIRAVKIA